MINTEGLLFILLVMIFLRTAGVCGQWYSRLTCVWLSENCILQICCHHNILYIHILTWSRTFPCLTLLHLHQCLHHIPLWNFLEGFIIDTCEWIFSQEHSFLCQYRYMGTGFLLQKYLHNRMRNQQNGTVVLTWMSLGMTSVPFLVLCAAAALLTYFFSRKKVTSQLMKATRGARYWSLVQKVLSLFLVTGTYRGFGLWWGRSSEQYSGMKRKGWRQREG